MAVHEDILGRNLSTRTVVTERTSPKMQAASPAAGKPMSNADLVDNLCAASPALCEARRRHMRSFGTLVPHVFMSNVLARVGFCLSLDRGDAGAEHRAEASWILAELEQGVARGERETRNVISLSFVSDAELELFFEDLKPLLGPGLRAHLHPR